MSIETTRLITLSINAAIYAILQPSKNAVDAPVVVWSSLRGISNPCDVMIATTNADAGACPVTLPVLRVRLLKAPTVPSTDVGTEPIIWLLLETPHIPCDSPCINSITAIMVKGVDSEINTMEREDIIKVENPTIVKGLEPNRSVNLPEL